MAYGNEADEIRVLGKLLAKGYVYRGLKPVNWCFDCGSALAEAEVEYEDRKDPAIDVGFAFIEKEKIAKAFGLRSCPRNRATSSSGRPRPGRCRPIRRSMSTRSSTTRSSTRTAAC
jgi:hypothetical protein